jgi:hypothetical protein
MLRWYDYLCCSQDFAYCAASASLNAYLSVSLRTMSLGRPAFSIGDFGQMSYLTHLQPKTTCFWSLIALSTQPSKASTAFLAKTHGKSTYGHPGNSFVWAFQLIRLGIKVAHQASAIHESRIRFVIFFYGDT